MKVTLEFDLDKAIDLEIFHLMNDFIEEKQLEQSKGQNKDIDPLLLMRCKQYR